jgi:hypothetical protein
MDDHGNVLGGYAQVSEWSMRGAGGRLGVYHGHPVHERQLRRGILLRRKLVRRVPELLDGELRRRRRSGQPLVLTLRLLRHRYRLPVELHK